MRVWAISDLHIDKPNNWTWLRQLSEIQYQKDVLIIAGDVTDNLDKLKVTFAFLQRKFSQITFVPGNHELWLRPANGLHSIDKFHQILEICATMDIKTTPFRLGSNGTAVWLVPLFSWYRRPEEGEGSLYREKPGEDASLSMWRDNYLTRWPYLGRNQAVADYFLNFNREHLMRKFDAPVISFSHFLPRQELIFSTPAERRYRVFKDPAPTFNFSRVAGCSGLDHQIRWLDSKIHIYGHQHRNRDRIIEKVRYISHCLGYPLERRHALIAGVEAPRLVWSSESGK